MKSPTFRRFDKSLNYKLTLQNGTINMSIALIYSPDSSSRKDWMARIKNELNELQARRQAALIK